MVINAIIIDDEERGISALEQLIAKSCPDVSICGTAKNINDGYDLIVRLAPDVVFLDVEMPEGNGFRLLEKFNKVNFDVIFVTAHNEYALKAIKFSALDYLLKPVDVSELQQTIEKIKNRKLERSIDQYDLLKSMVISNRPISRIVLTTLEGFYPVKLEDIIYCKADDSYTHFYLLSGKHYIVSKSLKDFDDLLPEYFFRIHKSFLVNLNHIESIKKADGFSVVMRNEHELPIASRKKDEFIQRIRVM